MTPNHDHAHRGAERVEFGTEETLENLQEKAGTAIELPPLVSVRRAGVYLKASEAKVRRLIKLKKLNAIKVGAHWRIPVDALARFLAENMR
jgi:excisionase family DNA binding protein